MSAAPTSEPESAFVCDCEEQVRTACAGEPFYREHEGKRYCVLHFPGKEKRAAFVTALKRKLENQDFNFRGVWFPDDVSFKRLTFTAAADFSFATFSAAANFRHAKFNATGNFIFATFGSAAEFNATEFSADANFISARFSAR